jgi:hypothetical protein
VHAGGLSYCSGQQNGFRKMYGRYVAKLLGNTALGWFPPTMPPERLQTMSASHRKHTLTHV